MKNKLKSWLKELIGQEWLFKLKILYSRFCDYGNIFYSQSGEDVILRVFIGDEQKKGYYVDVGAYHPKHISNTYCFYKKGWSGINIDANPRSIELFKHLRPKDTNLNFAISKNETDTIFYSWDSVYDTISKEDAEIVRAQRGKEKWSAPIRTQKLETVLDKYLPKGQFIDILSVDAEGCDLEVLQSNNWSKYKPRFIVVEDHSTNIQEILSSEKYKYIVSLGYKLCSFTCINLIFCLDQTTPEVARV